MSGKMSGYSDDKSVEIDTSGSLQSARIIVPILFENLKLSPKSVVDFGCARGAWLKACQENGVDSIQGFDGPYLNRSNLLIDSADFKPADLSHPSEIEGNWDMAICLEVVEHLSAEAGSALIRKLMASAPLVLFSAAVPGQGGRGHINEQWPSYWNYVFGEQGFTRLDPIRPHIWQNARVDWWYRQNIFLYVSGTALARSVELRRELQMAGNIPDEWVNKRVLSQYISVRGVLKNLPGIAWRAFKRRLGLHYSQGSFS